MASAAPDKKLAFAALHHKDFRAYFITTALAMMADNIEHVISYWLLYTKFHSPVLAGFAFSNSYPLSLALLFFAGALNLAFYSIAQTIVQLEAPRDLRGRLIGLFSMSAFGLRAFSGFTVGVMGGLIGIHWSLALSSMLLLAVTIALFAFAAQGRRGQQLG